MKIFTRSLLAAVAFSVAAIPMAEAGQRHDGPRQGHHYSQPKKPSAHAPKFQAPKYQAPKYKAPGHAGKRHQWSKGKRVPNWQRRAVVRDYHRHGLRRPGPGQHWVKVDNDYLLISVLSGIIGAIAASR